MRGGELRRRFWFREKNVAGAKVKNFFWIFFLSFMRVWRITRQLETRSYERSPIAKPSKDFIHDLQESWKLSVLHKLVCLSFILLSLDSINFRLSSPSITSCPWMIWIKYYSFTFYSCRDHSFFIIKSNLFTQSPPKDLTDSIWCPTREVKDMGVHLQSQKISW